MNNYPPYFLPRNLLNPEVVEASGGAGDDDDVIVAAGPVATSSGEIPKNTYCVLLRDCIDGKSGADQRMLTFEFEILTPDQVPSQQVDGVICSVAGRKFSMYVVIDPASKGFASARATLAKLALLSPDGNIRPKAIIAAAKMRNRFFLMVLECEETFHRLPKKPGQKEGEVMMFNGQKLSRGFRPALPNAEDIICPCAAPEGYVAAPF